MTSSTGPSPSELLDGLPVPAFGTDASYFLIRANQAFFELVGRSHKDAAGVSVLELFERAMGDGIDGALVLRDGRCWEVEVRPAEQGFVGWLRPRSDADASPTPPPAPVPDPSAKVLMELVESLVLPMRVEELIHVFARAFKRLLPAQLFCLRLVDTSSLELLHVFASGRLLEPRRDTVTVSSAGLDLAGRPRGLREGGAVRLADSYQRIFEGTCAGFDVPLQDGESFFGSLSFEYLEPPEDLETDRRLVWSVALHLSTALRNGRLLGESLYHRDFLDKLVDNANAPIVVTNRDRRIRVVNRAFEQLTGYDRNELLHKDFLRLLPENARERFLPVLIHALRGESTTSQEVRIPRKGGGSVRLALSTAAVTSGYGEIEGVVTIGQDLTELRQLQQQVIHSEKLATLGQLAAGVVHELNNPLTSISVYSDFLLKKLEREGGDESDRVKLSRICEGADRILRFTRDLVAYARPAGEEPQLVDLKDVVERSLVFCEHVIDRAGARVKTSFPDDLPPIYGLKGQLQQVLVNLITNACDAVEPGSGEIAVELETVGERVRMSVSDNGSGIPEDERRKVFEPFVSTKPEGKGTGLGLSIVRNIITNHNGFIEVVGGSEDGATFNIELFAAT